MDKKKKTIFYLVFLVFFMGSASFLSVPFYNWFCKVTGYGGTPVIASNSSMEVLSDVIKVRFDGVTFRSRCIRIRKQIYEERPGL